ncbi:hypothetical protein B5M42_012665 [Paenibacillus athensensis]|uniref:Uncharacterized protein n=1 Tax=Paenibacillus athensensis TaxID=1967502 RepID=A0A4Y8Q0R5_9BACL|nr:hypothetical protein [Paenibacillus athensensis]MCD1259686.1 hypothetical protein [Paenibacillus athensensis]
MRKITHADVARLLDDVQSGCCRLTDEEIVEMVGQWVPSHNCEDAAGGFLQVVPVLIADRPHLERVLLKIAIRPMFYLGIVKAGQVFAWVDGFVKRVNDRPSETYIRWLSHELTPVGKSALISDILRELQQEEA